MSHQNPDFFLGLAILPIPWLLESIAPINVGAKLKSWVLAFHATAAPMNKAIEVSLSTRTMAFLPMEVKIALHALVRLVLWDGALNTKLTNKILLFSCTPRDARKNMHHNLT